MNNNGVINLINGSRRNVRTVRNPRNRPPSLPDAVFRLWDHPWSSPGLQSEAPKPRSPEASEMLPDDLVRPLVDLQLFQKADF